MNEMLNKFELLRDKNVLAILDGDTDFGTLNIEGKDTGIKVSMPYLSGPDLCAISNEFGLPATYSWGKHAMNKSRWEYLDNLLSYCIKNGRESDLLAYLFSKKQFAKQLEGNTPNIIEFAYSQIVAKIIEQINGELYFGGNELVQIGNTFKVKEIGTPIAVKTPCIKNNMDNSYVKDLSERAMKDVLDGNYDSAITKSRTLLEEVFIYVIEQKEEKPTESGDIGKLYNQVKQLYNMHQNKDVDKRINSLLSGLEKILTSISDMRNKDSDSHGAGSKRIKIAEYHARLFVNSAMTMADFILAVSENALRHKCNQ